MRHFILSVFLLTACSSHPIEPSSKNIKVSRDEAGADCNNIGLVEGRSLSARATFTDALEDLKTDAARKGANFVKIETTSGTGTAVRGQAYFCP